MKPTDKRTNINATVLLNREPYLLHASPLIVTSGSLPKKGGKKVSLIYKYFQMLKKNSYEFDGFLVLFDEPVISRTDSLE
jgi:hypothetical protein